MCRLLLFDLVCFEITWYFSAIVAMPGCSKVFHLLSGRSCVTAKLSVLKGWFWVLEHNFCSILRLLLAASLHPWVAESAASILSLEEGKCEIASVQHLRAAC